MVETGRNALRRWLRRFHFWRAVVSLYLYVWMFLIVAAAAAGLVAVVVYDHVVQPGRAGPEIEVIVPKGASGHAVGGLLVEKGLLGYEGFFRLATKLDDTKRPILHGVYALPKGASALELLHILQEGPDRQLGVDAFRITIPEGLALEQAAQLVDRPQALLDAAQDPALLTRLGIQADTLEGFLMPNTYFFDAKPDEADLVERMVAQFEKEYAALVKEIPGADAYDKFAVVTVASLVEEEARVDSERPLVAEVIYNRLTQDMPLQMDSTLQYALGKYGQRMLEEDKEADSPYNTYTHAGLPPGPISNPGVASLRAALQPANEEYFYFVSNADGKTHTFSRTATEHEQAVAKYRREIATQRRAQEGEG